MFRVIVSKRPAVAVGKKGYRKQTIGVFLIDKDGVEDDFATPVAVLRGPDDQDYKHGEYTLHPSSFVVKADDFGSGNVVMDRLTLIPRVEAVARMAK